MSYDAITKRLASGGIVVLDGGTGTELERRGVPMTPGAWCGAASLDHFDILVGVHKDYIAAGAEIITVNSYASNRLMLDEAGLGEHFSDLNKAAVDAAHRARRKAGRDDVLVAGSLSHMCPLLAGTSAPDPTKWPSRQRMADAFGELAELHKAEGCDLILLEMMYCSDRMPLAFAAGQATGLPVWAGFSCRRGDDGTVLSFEPHRDLPFREAIKVLDDFDVPVAGVMHTPSNVVGDALDILRKQFDGPMTAYPDSGYFAMPAWQFKNIIPPEELRTFAQGWLTQGVQVLGGCCGLSPEHIEALAALRT